MADFHFPTAGTSGGGGTATGVSSAAATTAEIIGNETTITDPAVRLSTPTTYTNGTGGVLAIEHAAATPGAGTTILFITTGALGTFLAKPSSSALFLGVNELIVANGTYGAAPTLRPVLSGGALGTSSQSWGAVYAQRFVDTGATVAAGDFALSAGWGATATIDSIRTNSTNEGGQITITPGGAGIAADATVTLTFVGGAYAVAPNRIACMDWSATAAFKTAPPMVSVDCSTTTMILTLRVAPVSGEFVRLTWR